jgi:hypothetical protein
MEWICVIVITTFDDYLIFEEGIEYHDLVGGLL